MILGKGGGIGHAEHALVPRDRLFRVLAAIGGVVDAAELDGTCHSAGSSSTSSAPRRIWSSSIDLNRSEEHTSELQSLMRISYAVFCLQKKKDSHIVSNSQAHSHL